MNNTVTTQRTRGAPIIARMNRAPGIERHNAHRAADGTAVRIVCGGEAAGIRKTVERWARPYVGAPEEYGLVRNG